MLRTCDVRLPATAEVHRIREILPSTGHAFHIRLATQFSFRTDFARHACHFRRERRKLIHHRVDDVLDLENLPAHVHRDLLRQVTARDRRRHLGHIAQLHRQVAGHEIDVVRQILPRARDAFHDCLAAELSFGAYFARHARHFRRER